MKENKIYQILKYESKSKTRENSYFEEGISSTIPDIKMYMLWFNFKNIQRKLWPQVHDFSGMNLTGENQIALLTNNSG